MIGGREGVVWVSYGLGDQEVLHVFACGGGVVQFS